MPCESRNTTIDGVEYATTQWPATIALLMKMRLIKLFGGPIMELLVAVKENEDDALEGMQKAISKLMADNDPEEVVTTLKQILTTEQCTKRDGVRITESSFDEIYNDAGMPEMYRACLFVVRANYEDFFKGQKVENLLAKADQL